MISAQNVSVSFGDQPVVREVSLNLVCCRITAIVGPSGSGKSTFLNALNRMTDLLPGARVEGQILVGGQNVLAGPEAPTGLRQRIGMIFQRPNPFPMSIERNMHLALREQGIRDKAALRSIAKHALERVGLWDEVKDRLHASALELSGGQQQRLCIARALALEPEALLFDEPTSALDPMSAQVIERLIAELGQTLAIAVVTHDLAQARRLADDLAVFVYRNGCGQMAVFGPVDDVLFNPRDAEARNYLIGMPRAKVC